MPDIVRDVQEHLRLAQGLLTSATALPLDTEYDIRNALSRSYYALYHICKARLGGLGVSVRKLNHKALQRQIELHFGVSFKDRLQDFYVVREQADYWPEFFAIRFGGDLGQLRVFAATQLALMDAEFRRYLVDVEDFCKRKQGQRNDRKRT